MNIRVEVGYATAVANYDLATGDVNARLPVARKISGLAYVGSAAAADSVIELVVNNKSEGKFENSSTGKAIDRQKDVKPLDVFVPANALIQALVRTAPGTNPVVCYIEFAAPTGRGGFRRFGGRRWGARSTGGRRTRTPAAGMY